MAPIPLPQCNVYKFNVTIFVNILVILIICSMVACFTYILNILILSKITG